MEDRDGTADNTMMNITMMNVADQRSDEELDRPKKLRRACVVAGWIQSVGYRCKVSDCF